MKTINITMMWVFVLCSHFVVGQNSNLVFFAENGEPFYIVLNGIQQNEKPQSNIKITGLLPGAWKVRVIFSDNTIAPIDKTLYMDPGMEYTYNIKQGNKGIYVLRMFNQVPVASAAPSSSKQTVIVYSSTPPVSQTTVTYSTTTTTTTTVQPDEGVSINVNVGGVGGGVNASVGTTGQTTTVTTTTTTTTTSSGITGGQDVYVMPGYSGAVGCNWPMSEQEFAAARQSVQSKTFEDSKLTVAKQICKGKCLLASQVRDLMLLFDYEETRLDFAKYAYAYTFDIDNYYMVNDAFQYESSIEELNSYIHGRR